MKLLKIGTVITLICGLARFIWPYIWQAGCFTWNEVLTAEDKQNVSTNVKQLGIQVFYSLFKRSELSINQSIDLDDEIWNTYIRTLNAKALSNESLQNMVQDELRQNEEKRKLQKEQYR